MNKDLNQYKYLLYFSPISNWFPALYLECVIFHFTLFVIKTFFSHGDYLQIHLFYNQMNKNGFVMDSVAIKEQLKTSVNQNTKLYLNIIYLYRKN